MQKLSDNSIDAVVTDPPYELGFMGKSWDSTGIAYNKDVWKEVLRILKPGGHLLAFGGTRTYHRMACAIEDAGFEIRDMMQWIYSQGFPKSYDISKGIDKKLGKTREVIGVSDKQPSGFIRHGRDDEEIFFGVDAKRTPAFITAPASDEAKQWSGWGTALKPANEPIVLARKPLSEKTVADNVMRWGTGGINIDDSRIGTEERTFLSKGIRPGSHNIVGDDWTGNQGNKTVVGRFPANVLLDESAAAILDEQSGISKSIRSMRGVGMTENAIFKTNNPGFNTMRGFNDSGGASRFFYCAKASKKERGEGNIHPTVKPISLMEYLVKLVTREGQTVLDPFMGSGSTGVACKNTNRNFIGIELDETYYNIAKERIGETK
jgi:site-specific DNA-methyltransferase (adenine-specific)